MSVSQKILDINISECGKIISPIQLRSMYPLDREAVHLIAKSRETVSRIIQKKDPNERYKDSLVILMRTYFEKLRTSLGWKGYINDPDLNNSFEIEKGLCRARKLLLFMADLELPCATEALDPVIPQYLGDLISWVAIGARTSESQVHREMASGLQMPVGFKNGTDENIQIATYAGESLEGRTAVSGSRSGKRTPIRRFHYRCLYWLGGYAGGYPQF